MTPEEISNYIEIEINKGRSLADIRCDLRSKVPAVLLEKALKNAFQDEVRFIRSSETIDVAQKSRFVSLYSRLWFVFVIFFLLLITFGIMLIANNIAG